MRQLRFGGGGSAGAPGGAGSPGAALPCGGLTVEQLRERLATLGYRLAPSEVADIAREMGISEGGVVAQSQFAASQMEWGQLQVNHRDEWLACLQATFEGLDRDGDGRISASEIMRALADKLPEEEVNAAIEDVLLEAACEEDEGLDFAAFAALARVPSEDLDLDQYDARLPRHGRGLNMGDGWDDGGAGAAALTPGPARRASGDWGVRPLETVPEAEAQ